MQMRSVAAAAALFSVLCAAQALAVEANPISGVGVSVEQSPGGLRMPSADCKPPKGTLKQDAHGKWLCVLTPARATTTTVKPLTTAPVTAPHGN